jgi:ACR3 family arsenite efflux pump ArsB
MRDVLTDSDDLSPMRRGGIGSMVVLLSSMVSIVVGVIFPTTGMSLEPYIIVRLGGLLYVNLINLHSRHLVSTFRKPKTLMVFTIGKLILLPCIVYIIAFLETYRKTEVADPIHKWIGTYNIYRIYLLFFSNGYITPILNPAKDLNLQ